MNKANLKSNGSSAIEVQIISMECICGKKFEGIDKKRLKRRMNRHIANCEMMRFLKDLNNRPEFKDRPLLEILKELGWTK